MTCINQLFDRFFVHEIYNVNPFSCGRVIPRFHAVFLIVMLLPIVAVASGEDRHEANVSDDYVNEEAHDETGEVDGEEGEDDEHGNGESYEETVVNLSTYAQQLANIKMGTLQEKVRSYQLYTPAEITCNAYNRYLVSPRVDSIVVRRHVALGDTVKAGQPLVTLFSETVAAAQADFLIDHSEWLRVKKLGRENVGDKRYITTQANYDASYGRLQAFGLSTQAIEDLFNGSNRKMVPGAAKLGHYQLLAAIEGVVLADDFTQGQRVLAGETLIDLSDESSLWVEARLASDSDVVLMKGAKARVNVANKWYQATVIQQSHTIDRATRSRIVRLVIDNKEDHLHSGMFADVYFQFNTKGAVLALPETALMRRADGNWTVFVELSPGQFQAREVTRGDALIVNNQPWRQINGIEAGSRVVLEGAFFVASESAKGGFDPHNH